MVSGIALWHLGITNQSKFLIVISNCDYLLYKRASISIGVLFGEPGGGLIYRRLWEKDEGGCGDGASLSDEAPWRGPWGGGEAPSLETLEDMFR